MREIALHILDIAENSVSAGADAISIRVLEDLVEDRLAASIEDDGKGMDSVQVEKVIDPFFTSRTTRKVGLGIPLLKEAAEACNGFLRIDSKVGQGTKVEVEFQCSHIDRMPLGDLAGTILSLVVAYPQIHWTFVYEARLPGKSEPEIYRFNDRAIKDALSESGEQISLCEPEVLGYLRQELEQGVRQVKLATNSLSHKESVGCLQT